MNNLEWLYKNNDAVCKVVNMFAAEEHYESYDGEIREWLMAEHESCNQDADQAERENVGGCESDSREKLEADVRKFAEKSGWLYPMAGARIVFEWLDRQAAITEREWSGYLDEAIEQLNEASEKVDELTAERDRWKVNYEQRNAEANEYAERLEEFVATVPELISRYTERSIERDYWKRQFRKCLEATRCGNVDNLMAYPLPEGLVEPYLMVVDEIDSERDFSADVARLEAEIKRLEGELKTQRNNFDQATGARDYWKQKLSILLQRLRDMGCQVGNIHDVPIEVELPERDEGLA